MSEDELIALSREAARCLPEGYRKPPFDLGRVSMAQMDGTVYYGWLHESTEACTEIMVRVLNPVGIIFDGSGAFKFGEGFYLYCETVVKADESIDDPMLAFRVAVLRALIALKGK